jgi:hypothetical protein
MMVAGSASLVYSGVRCLTKESVGDVNSSLLAGAITGAGWGLVARSSNKMFMGGFYGALMSLLVVSMMQSGRFELAPQLTYHQRIAARQEMTNYTQGDGYVHQWLQPGLKRLGIRIPESWPALQEDIPTSFDL